MSLSSWHRVIAWKKTSTVGQSPYWFTMARWLHRVLPTILLNWLVIFAVTTKGLLYFWPVWRVLICWGAGCSFDSNRNRRKVNPWGWIILIHKVGESSCHRTVISRFADSTSGNQHSWPLQSLLSNINCLSYLGVVTKPWVMKSS